MSAANASTEAQDSKSEAPSPPQPADVTPPSTPSVDSNKAEMDGAQPEKAADDAHVEPQTSQQTTVSPETSGHDATKSASVAQKTKSDHDKCHKGHKKSKHAKKGKKKDISSSGTSSSDDSDDSSDDSEDSSSEDEKQKKKSRKQRARRRKSKSKSKHSKRAKPESESDDDDSDVSNSDSDSSEDERTRRKSKKSKKSRKAKEDDLEDEEDDEEALTRHNSARQAMRLRKLQRLFGSAGLGGSKHPSFDFDELDGLKPKSKKKRTGKSSKKSKSGSTLEFKRVDQLWDSTIHNYKLTESAEDPDDEFHQYVFTVRRKFDWENKYKSTVVDVKSKLLREALQEVMKDVKGVSLVEDKPSIDPNMLFLYLEELRTYAKKTLKARIKTEKKRKTIKRQKLMIAHCKVLVKYLDADYEETKKTLYPMLEAGNITFDLLWALFKPNILAYTTTYGSVEDPRCFKVDYATKQSSFIKGDWYCIEGRYLEYDGKAFGLGEFEMDIDSFKGPRKITSLMGYPLANHKDPEGLKKLLIERGKHFVSMEGMNYRFHKGLAFMKKKKVVAKVNINGRIMCDAALFRRINPNYPISLVKKDDPNAFYPEDDSDSDACSCCGSDDSLANDTEALDLAKDEPDRERVKYKVVFDEHDHAHVVEVPVDADGREMHVENIDKLPEGTDPKVKRDFTEEELLIASPVILGFAFSEKLWLEFSISGIRDIEWNEGAFDSLVLPAKQKSIVKALVESHKFHAAKTIDDVVQGKGKGLVAVLHGPPGTGKTLTAEGIAELLKCPLYMVSAGELGTDPGRLEHELQKILDIAHSWGAVLLLDEADVFLEKREVHDIHRNALVSIFLRLLEYFQGILFLTTNRVETFDDAFQSRIHVALRYGELTVKAKKSVWKMFLDKVRKMEDVQTVEWAESDFDTLARRSMNGRQIKNAVRTAQALAVNERSPLNMEHIKRVLDVAESFEMDLKGGTGYADAMRSYT
ncbi:MAG: hypothetical protein M1828_000523 [Chrysothrix sp. TS-e1954]|nr:MAG: hypothetical protein M1828_000523 [Chrysothrix sp. TS-e1954]